MSKVNDANFYRNLKKEYPVITRGEGVYLYDDKGNEYIDFGAGIGVTCIGYSVSEVTEQMAKQMQKTTFAYNGYFTNEPRIALSQNLIKFCPDEMTKVILANSGSEANEVAIKIARQYHLETGNQSKYKVISRRRSYHGNTLGSLSVSGRPSWKKDFEPYMYDFPQIADPYCYRCPFGLEYPVCGVKCAHDLEDVITAHQADNVSAFIAEPIVGTTVTAVVPVPEYYGIIREICDKYDVLFIADEVITGIGRTGKNFGMEHWQVTADMMVASKGLAAGYAPLSAVIVRDKVFEAIAKGSGAHMQGFTYSGNPLSCTAGLAVLNYIEANNLVERSARQGEYLQGKLEILKDTGIVGDIRGKGLLVGIEFVADEQSKRPFPVEVKLTERIATKAFEMGLVLITGMFGCADGVNGDHLQLSPAFVITEEQIDKAIDIMHSAIKQSIKEIN